MNNFLFSFAQAFTPGLAEVVGILSRPFTGVLLDSFFRRPLKGPDMILVSPTFPQA
jgi:hypothetical protein